MAAEDIVVSGVGKTRAELAQGLDRGIGQFNIEHEPEGIALAEIALAKETTAQAVLRVNPDVDAGTHAKISTGKAEKKFGVGIDRSERAAGRERVGQVWEHFVVAVPIKKKKKKT